MTEDHSTDQRQRLAQAQDAIRSAHQVTALAWRTATGDANDDQQNLAVMRVAERLIREATERLEAGALDDLLPGGPEVMRQTYKVAAYCEMLANAKAARTVDDDGVDAFSLLEIAAEQSRALLDAVTALASDHPPLAA
ncbi:MAG: hypothetical protein ACQET2_14290 [Pseudomonadota bacterium]